MKIILIGITSIAWAVTLAGIFKLNNFNSYYAGYIVGIFLMLYYFSWIIYINNYEN